MLVYISARGGLVGSISRVELRTCPNVVNVHDIHTRGVDMLDDANYERARLRQGRDNGITIFSKRLLIFLIVILMP